MRPQQGHTDPGPEGKKLIDIGIFGAAQHKGRQTRLCQKLSRIDSPGMRRIQYDRGALARGPLHIKGL